jgi:hypothetical protein
VKLIAGLIVFVTLSALLAILYVSGPKTKTVCAVKYTRICTQVHRERTNAWERIKGAITGKP